MQRATILEPRIGGFYLLRPVDSVYLETALSQISNGNLFRSSYISQHAQGLHIHIHVGFE